MHIRSQQLGARGASMDMKTLWAAQEYDSTFPKLETMARFQQKQLQEKEQKLLQLYDQQQQRAYQVVQRGSAGSNGSNHGSRTASTTTTVSHASSTSQGGKVRQMFDERRHTTVKGIDRSYPLEPLDNKLRKQANTNGVATQRNGNAIVNRQSVKRVSRADVNSNVNGGKPVVSYHEDIIRESFGPSIRRHDDEDEYENRVTTFANGHYRHEADNEQEETLEMIERNRMMAKIHLMGFDETLKHRVRNDLESEEFPEYLMVEDMPDKFSKRNVTKKLSQAEERLERFKNANAKRSNMPKQSTSTNTTIRKRSEQVIPTKSNSRLWNEIAGTSPTNSRSGSGRTSECSQRILENANSPLSTRTTRVVDEMSARRRESLDTETLGQRTNPRDFSTREAAKTKTISRIRPRSNEYKSLTSDGKIFIRRSASPQFFSRESEKSGTAISIDRKSNSSRSPLFHRETSTKRSKSPFFLNEFKTNESKSPAWEDKGISLRQSTSPQTSTSFGRPSTPSTSSLYQEKLIKRRSTSPQFFCKESERSATTMSIDRATNESKSPSYDREIVMKRSESPRFFLSESEQSRRTSESKSPIWGDREISSKRSTSSQYLHYEPTVMNTDRKSIRSKSFKLNKGILTKRDMTDFERRNVQTSTSLGRQSSPFTTPLYQEKLIKRRSTSPQFFCKESERSATTMSIDRATSESKSPSYDREIVTKRSGSPRFFLNESEQSRRTSESKSPVWGDRGISSRQSTSPQYFRRKSKRSETADISTDRETIESKSSEWNKRGTSPRFFCRESKRSGTTMNIDRKVGEPRSSYEYKKIFTKRSATPRLLNGKTEQRSASTTSIDRKYNGFKSPIRDKRSTSPQFFCRESERSATTMLIEPRSKSADSTKSLKQHNISDTFYRRSIKSPTDKMVNSTKDRYTPSATRHEVKKASKKTKVSSSVTEARRSSKISETSATSSSSIVNLKYGLEFDNIFQSAGLVRKFMKSQGGKQHASRQSPPKRNVNARICARGNQSKTQRKTSPLLQTARSPPIEGRKRATPEFTRKSITPTEVDMDIQEITMTDHRIERDKLQKAPSPISKRQFDGTYMKSSNSAAKFKTSITYPVHKTHRQRGSILESTVFKSKRGPSERTSMDHRSDRERNESVISLNKLDFSPTVESPQRTITRDREDENKMSFRTRRQSAKDQVKYIATQSTKHEDRQRASSRSPNQMRNRSAESRADSPKVTSPNFSRVKKYPDTVSPILYDFTERRTKGARTTFDQPQSLRSTRLVQGTIKDKNLFANDKYYERGGDEDKNVGVDEVDAGIGVKYQKIVKTALNKENKDYRKIIRPNSADRITNKRVFLRETMHTPIKSSTSKKTISPMRECGGRQDVKSRVSPRVLPLRKTGEISRGVYIPKISSSRSSISKTDQSSTSKFSTYNTVEDRGRESVLAANKLAESFDKMSVKRKTEEPANMVREFPKIQRENNYEKNLERMDSVESALRRFDSIGAEFERSSLTSLQTSPEISLQTMDIQRKASVKESIGSEGTTVPAREITDRTILRATLKSPVGKDQKAKNAARKTDLKILKKETCSSRRPTKGGSSTKSKERSTKIRSPPCKRRLFESDSEKEIQEERPKSNCAKVRKDENSLFVNLTFRKGDAISNVRSSKYFDRDVTREPMASEKTFTFVKSLRSIEDIRKSIDNEQSKLVATKESRSAIANRRSASRVGVDAKRSSPTTDAGKIIFLKADPARPTTIKTCVSRITKSPSPDLAATKQRKTNARTIRGSAPSSPLKSPDVAPRRASTDSRNQETKPSRRSTKGADSIRNKAATGTIDIADGVVFQNGSPNEFTTRKFDSFDFDDRKEDDATSKKSSKKSFNDKQQTASSASGRPTSSSNSRVNLIQDSNAKGRMTENERGKAIGKGGGKNRVKGMEKSSCSNGKLSNTSFNEDTANDTKGLVKCKTCGRSFAQNRVGLHEQICMKTTTKKRKQFDPVMNRVKGTELEPFVKKNLTKRETRPKKPGNKPDWRRKHEEFISAIRYARETQAQLAAGGNLSDLPPPPPSDTSDYIQCEHCGRKFNRSAAERHIPICKRMHDKKQTQAPRARR